LGIFVTVKLIRRSLRNDQYNRFEEFTLRQLN
jgi:hypothetical protein